ncbi:Nucleoid occlusion protein [Novipirellula aureliae]|uniref:Nucleoid occlusion protein n=1 Tax=Novipirellula aureliae TaxID=2527966 RepID=A0A5C6DJA3_9BACT|nr:ParB N-terminal domain-containing protein [Novipirellula aureliae]TWU35661.1 Nucleoid occlusion protein [Novipirellula aureliae]
MRSKKVRIENLTHHQWQGSIISDLQPKEFASLKNDIEQRGLQTPILVTRDFMVIDGHQRLRACVELKFDEIDAVYFEPTSEHERDQAFLLNNIQRRQMGVVARARAIQKLVEIERAKMFGCRSRPTASQLRDRIAKSIGGSMSGRTVDRYIQLLRLPTWLQDCVDRGEVGLVLALKCERLDRATLESIEAKILTGVHPKKLIKSALDEKPTSHAVGVETDTEVNPYDEFLDTAAWFLNWLDDDIDSIVGTAAVDLDIVATLDRMIQTCTAVRDGEATLCESS